MSDKIVEISLGEVMTDIVNNRRYHQWIPLGQYGLEVCCVSPGAPSVHTRLRREGSPERDIKSICCLPTASEYQLLPGPGGPMYVLSGIWPKVSLLGQSDDPWWKIGVGNG